MALIFGFLEGFCLHYLPGFVKTTLPSYRFGFRLEKGIARLKWRGLHDHMTSNLTKALSANLTGGLSCGA